MIAQVHLAEFSNGERAVVKFADGIPLDVEAHMLQFLAGHTRLPVPGVLHVEADLLALEYLSGSSQFDSASERHAAELLAELHSLSPVDLGLVATPLYGFPWPTLLGPFRQENDWHQDWPRFFAERRLGPLLAECLDRGRLPPGAASRMEKVLAALPNLLAHAPTPGLIHGDVWSGNVLAERGRISGFLDPAIYFADPEIELAFIDLFSTFGTGFHERYRESRSVSDGYEERRDIYQLYPLLVHVALFGGSYVGALEQRFARLGF